MKIAVVVWTDITWRGGWHTQSKLDKYTTDNEENEVQQVGYVLEDDETQIVLLDSYFTSKDTFGSPTKIPRGCVKSITYIEPPTT